MAEHGTASRRTVLLGAVAAAGAGAMSRRAHPAKAAAAAAAPLDGGTRTWLGSAYWANRLPDWRRSAGRIECVAPESAPRLRTVGLLSISLAAGAGNATLRVRTGTLAAGSGFSGFLLGAGGGALDPRAAALVQAASGTGGGLLCVYCSDGTVAFRDHTDESAQFVYAPLSSSRTGPAPARTLSESVQLTLTVAPGTAGSATLTLRATDAAGALLSSATRSVPGTLLTGGLSLVSAVTNGSAARHWFGAPTATGSRVTRSPARAVGPVLGTLFSVAAGVLKCTAVLLPIGPDDPQSAILEYRPRGSGAWRHGATAEVGPGFAALFRVAGWDGSKPWDYRIRYGTGTAEAQLYPGTVPAEPAGRPCVIGMINCTIHSFRPLDVGSSGAPTVAGEHELGLYTERSLYFPYRAFTANLAKQGVDLLVAHGDQYYENRPTLPDRQANPLLDTLGRFYLWMWAFRELTARLPCIVQVDDHDMYQGNLWGHGGAAAVGGDQNRGGYVRAPQWVNTVQQVQCGHDPDPYDTTPALQGIRTYYTAFRYGGVAFAVVEDRKFKSGDADGLDSNGQPFPAAKAQLMGSRQEAFLRAWGAQPHTLPRVCLTQTLWACLQTDGAGAANTDYDSDGYPPNARMRAIALLTSAHAVLLGGDQHLGSLVRHGHLGQADGPVQFITPAAGSSWPRWFTPAAALPHAEATPYTGDFTDAFGNRLHVLAVANPSIGQAQWVNAHDGHYAGMGDQSIKKDGYGILRVDPAAAVFTFECWEGDVDPSAPGARQLPGWPYRLPFADA